ncbi:MAG: DUF1634 domain-containing protein [Chloroflexi bacterium]|nr:DUF1634 domain-containing protein [Chloroflexota bacterium]
MKEDTGLQLEAHMRRISALVSFAAVLLMAVGFVDVLLSTPIHEFPGPAALSIADLVRPHHVPWGLWAMSAGIVLLALLPMLRVFLALILFFRLRRWIDVAAGFIVFVELLLSIHVEG